MTSSLRLSVSRACFKLSKWIEPGIRVARNIQSSRQLISLKSPPWSSFSFNSSRVIVIIDKDLLPYLFKGYFRRFSNEMLLVPTDAYFLAQPYSRIEYWLRRPILAGSLATYWGSRFLDSSQMRSKSGLNIT